VVQVQAQRAGPWDARVGEREWSKRCPSCASCDNTIFYEVDGVPAQSCMLLPSREVALAYPRGTIRLAFCHSCGFIWNTAFDAGLVDYARDYEETQGFSPRFRGFLRGLAERLVERYNLRRKQILEIGCGKGEFLALLCELGENCGTGIDPAYVPGRLHSAAMNRMTFIRDYYSAAYLHLAADFICCRHTLEHIQPVRAFVELVRRSIGQRPDVIVFFEVPDVLRILRELAFWDIYHEHCSYFSAGSLARLFRSCDFAVLALTKDYGDQYVLLEAQPGRVQGGGQGAETCDLEELAGAVAYFRENHAQKVAYWRDCLDQLRAQGRRAVLWGSGSKAVAFLTTLQVQEEIEYVVDVNPFRHNRYMPGTAQRIVAPASLREYRPEVIIVMNPLYQEEIRQTIEHLGVQAELLSV
jgi:2-polyprenyl-3-methyl-5-hydroxy-6-metoxy-1,4-benzoquinol methylase